ncbi:MAG: chromosome segregation protein SMC [Propionibacteriaceae bacterium]|jgi:chromosome segregation protein|nr:chromosome segregation protein SMC [Propionibacteriaceae bacterium]
MYLKRLTLRGFKSFASATTMVFEPGITAIVGPNGSGKSNVVDALAWVMGEQGPKHLRGGSMEDVIFAGTRGRPALGRAEVVLTIDNSDQALPIEYSEVTIARTKFRNGASEYAINGTPCRLLDVRELLSDSGMGREMHVIVGQGQLDAILQATPETRRGFIEEAAGVLKHRERKEKAVRKLEATQTNLNRLADLVGEIRRQLKPLGRQAEVARRAGVIQADLRDAKARLLADDLFQATAALETELADEANVAAQKAETERRLADARAAEEQAEQAAAGAATALARAQETWYVLSGLAEQVRSTISLASERVRRAELEPAPDPGAGRDPETLEAQAAETLQAELALHAEIETGTAALAAASAARAEAEAGHARAESEYAAQLRAEADRREGLARLAGQAGSLRSRVEAAEEQAERLGQAAAAAAGREAAAQQDVDGLGGDAGLEGVEAAVTAASAALAEVTVAAEAAVQAVAAAEVKLREAGERRAGLAARIEALQLSAERADAAALLAESGDPDLPGPASGRLKVTRGYEAAVTAALGQAVEAVAARDLAASLRALDRLKAEDLGRAGLLVAGAPAPDRAGWPALPTGPVAGSPVVWAADCVEAAPEWRAAVDHLLRAVVVVDDLAAAGAAVAADPELVAVTRAGDLVSAWFAAGGSAAKPSPLQVQAAIDSAQAELEDATQQAADQAEALEAAKADRDAAAARVAAARQELDAAKQAQGQARQAEGLARQALASAQAEARRLTQQLDQVAAARERDAAGLAELVTRLERAEADEGEAPADPAERDRLAEAAKAARAAEMDARLKLRTVEERARSLTGRAEALRQAAAHERAERAKAAAARARLVAEAKTGAVVLEAARWLAARVEASLGLAGAQRDAAEAGRADAAGAAQAARAQARKLAEHLEALVDSAHRDELARAQQRMRLDALAERALTEVGIEAEALLADYGPGVPIPLAVTGSDGEDEAESDAPLTYPFDRQEQLDRLRRAERDLQVLGKINPLALEEFDALQERHNYLSEQLDDLKKTRQDLLEIIADVDARVEQVFAQAYADVERAFADVFARLFPGGEGRLFLTEPGQWLTTGVDVEARPAGKTVKRLSLLSGGERSLVAICFLLALFKARPSPFYILDEVEAALDDTNLGRLLDVYEELRNQSQLLVITHQKRTMEIADTLYGVSMRDDGISKVVSQRLREE